MSNDRMHDLDASNRALWAEVKAVRAENDRLRAELAELRVNSNAWRNDALKTEAAIARVRELCEFRMRNNMDIDGPDILAAIEGEHT